MAKNTKNKHFNYQKVLTFLHVVLDIVSICLAFFIAYHLWTILGPILSIDMYEKVDMKRYSLMYGVSLITLLIGSEVNDLYHPQRSMLNIKEFQQIFKTWALSLGVTMVILYLAVELYFSRGIFLLTWITILICLLLERYAFFKFNSLLASSGIIETRVLIYGNNTIAWELANKFQNSPKLGYSIQGYIHDGSEVESLLAQPVLGGVQDLKDIIIQTKAERIFIAVAHLSSERVIEILKICRETNCKFQVVPSIYDLALEQVKLKDLEGIPLLAINELKFSWSTTISKRIFDVFASFFLLILFWPLTLGMAVLMAVAGIKPVVEKVPALGKNKKVFTTFLFKGISKSRKKTSSEQPPFLNVLLNRSGLERYPQLWSVFTGSMSLIGPKFETPDALDHREDITNNKYNIKPGLTGLWDIANPRKLVKLPDKDMNIFYIQNQSLFLDVIILTKVSFLWFRSSLLLILIPSRVNNSNINT